MYDTYLNEERDANQEGIDLDNFDLEAELKKYEDLDIYHWEVLVRVYIPDTTNFTKKDGTKSMLIRPETTVNQHRYTACIGLVVKMGAEAFIGDSFDPVINWPKLGDWVLIPRAAITQFSMQGIPLQLLKDREIKLKTKCPRLFNK